ncbi:MAG TPA: putative LPS assembly protein LptD [Candidatus Eisenbacteria bacterium]|nr:putative LPS assembly protein LptD [Candidatus Eisenbacteria bacterium]
MSRAFVFMALAILAATATVGPALAQPPLNISAANVTGSRGPEGDIVLLNGDVRITRGLTVITADRGRYLRAQGMLYLDDRVRLVDTTTTLSCDHAAFSEEKDLLQVTGNVVITDKGATLRAPSGTYDRGRGRAELYGGVVAEDSSQIIRCEQLTYWRDSMLVKARGRVRGEGKKDRLRLLADNVDYDRRRHVAVATGKPVMESEDERGRVARISAKRLRLDTETRRAEAIDSVVVDRDTLKATGDYAVFDDRADRGWLYGHPKAWDNETTVTGDTLEVWTEKRTLRRFVVRSNATLDYKGVRPGSEGETSRLTGERMDVFFTDDEMDSLTSVGDARNEYQAVARPGKTPESNVAAGDTITVHLKDRKIDRAVVRGHATGEYRLEVATGDTAAARLETVKYRAPRIEFHVPKDRIILDEGAQLDYREVSLNSRRVEFDSQEQVLVASGRPQIVDRGDKVEGHLMTYDLESREGTIYQAETTYERGLYHGERIRKVGENELDVKSGEYSTCSLDHPHYHFQAKWMKIYLKDKMVAKPVVFYVRNVPLLALPFWIFPIKPGRHSGFIFPQFEIGLSTTAGQFIRNAGYYYAPNDYMDLTVAGDYYQAEPSWLIRSEANYKLLYSFDGQITYTYQRSENPLSPSDNYDFNAYHQQDITPRTRLQARGQFVSSRAYSKSVEFGRPLSSRVNRFLTSNLALSHAAEWANLYLVIDRRQDLDADEQIKDPDGQGPLQGSALGTVASLPNLTQSLPNLSVSFPTRAIGSLGFLRDTPFSRSLASMYFSLDSRVLAQTEQRAVVSGYSTFLRADSTLDSTTVISQIKSDRWGSAANASLRDSRRLFGWLNFSPAFNASAVLWDFDNLGNEFVPSATWNASLATSTTYYGTSRLQWGPLVGIRHVVFPSVSFRYSPSFDNLLFTDSLGVIRSRFTPFGGIGISGFRAASMGFSLDQRWQVKLLRKGKEERLDNLLQWSMSSGYNFLYEEQGQEHPLAPINSVVRFSPPGAASGDLNWLVDVYEKRPLRALNYSMAVNFTGATTRPSNTPEIALDKRAQQVQVDFAEPWSLGLVFSYSGGYLRERDWESTQTVNGVTRFNLTPNWRLEYSTAVNLTNRELLTQRFGLVRDLHCWQASFTRIFNIGGEAEYYFRLSVKDQRELYVERGTRMGSVGGIQ